MPGAKAARWAKTLGEAARVSPLHAEEVRIAKPNGAHIPRQLQGELQGRKARKSLSSVYWRIKSARRVRPSPSSRRQVAQS